MELALCHPSRTQNSEMVPIFLGTSMHPCSNSCDMQHLQDQRVTRPHTFLDTSTLYLMCMLAYVATSETDLTI
jgi:hypothetical protein